MPNQPVIGIALGVQSFIFQNVMILLDGIKKLEQNLIYTMDAYVVVLTPYNYLLGGKLIAYLLTSRELRKIYRDKYRHQITLNNKRNAYELAGLFTTGLYGKSSLYNRITYDNKLLYIPTETN